MSVVLVPQESDWLIRMNGQVTLASAVELKAALCEWLAAGKNLELDLESVEEIDLTILQLLWAASREAGDRRMQVAGRSEAVVNAVRAAGFEQMAVFSA